MEKIDNLDAHSSNLLQSIYDYFGSNYGYVDNDSMNHGSELEAMSVIDLRKNLKSWSFHLQTKWVKLNEWALLFGKNWRQLVE